MRHKRDYWKNKENVFNEAKKYKTKKEFKEKCVSAFLAAYKYGYMNEMTWLVTKKQRPKGYWAVMKNVIYEAKKYKTKKEFRENNITAYRASLKYNWIDNIKWPTNKKSNGFASVPKGYWKNKENVFNEAKKYTSKDEFKEKNLTAFLAAYKYGYMNEMTWLVTKKQKPKGYWNYKNIENEALKYETKTDFFKGNQTAYRKALKMNILDDFFVDLFK